MSENVVGEEGGRKVGYMGVILTGLASWTR
jgi:hypothetical protein